jgi:hypothetical protein
MTTQTTNSDDNPWRQPRWQPQVATSNDNPRWSPKGNYKWPRRITQVSIPTVWCHCRQGLSSGVSSRVIIPDCHLGLSSVMVIRGCTLAIFIWGFQLGLSQGLSTTDVIRGCHLSVSSRIVIRVIIWGCHLELSAGILSWLSSRVVIYGCHLELSAGILSWWSSGFSSRVVTWSYHLGCHLGCPMVWSFRI